MTYEIREKEIHPTQEAQVRWSKAFRLALCEMPDVFHDAFGTLIRLMASNMVERGIEPSYEGALLKAYYIMAGLVEREIFDTIRVAGREN